MLTPSARIVVGFALSAAAVGCSAGPAWSDSFESYAPGSFPGGRWRDFGTEAVPVPPLPTGTVTQTTGMNGSSTRAFQVYQRSGRSQGIIADIDHADTHRFEADLRVDLHPTPSRFDDWTAALGYFKESDPAADINFEPQGIVYVYNQRWWFYGATGFGNPTNIQLGSAVVTAGTWYHVSLGVDTRTGVFNVQISDAAQTLINRQVGISGYIASTGRYNRVGIYDGEYSGQSATPGQFSADNVSYVPTPATAAALLGLGVVRRRRKSV